MRRWLWVAGVMVMVLLSALRAPHYRPFDDAYITFGYARNLAEGHGFTFNPAQPPAERVCGTTAPGFAVLLAAGYAVTGAPPDKLALGLYWLLLAVLALMIGAIVGGGLVGFAAATLTIACPYWHVAGYGNETLLFAVIGVLTLALAQRSLAGAALLAGASVLVRPEAVLLWPAICIARREARKAYRLHALWIAGLALLPVLCLALTGEPLPHSMIAKLHQGALRSHGSVWLLPVRLAAQNLSVPNTILECGTLILLIICGGASAWRNPIGRAAVLWLGLHTLAITVVRAPCYPWYVTGMVTPAVLVAGWGVQRLLKDTWPAAMWPKLALTCWLLALVPLGQRASNNYLYYHHVRRGQPYGQVAAYIASHRAPGDWLLAWEGAQTAYMSRVNWTDPCGLVERSWNDWERDPRLALAFARTRRLNVRWVLFYMPAGIPHPLAVVPGFSARYREVLKIPAATLEITLYERRDGGDHS